MKKLTSAGLVLAWMVASAVGAVLLVRALDYELDQAEATGRACAAGRR